MPPHPPILTRPNHLCVPPAPQNFVRCPICQKTVPGFYINSHVDAHLEPQAGPSTTKRKQKEQQQQPSQPGTGGRGKSLPLSQARASGGAAAAALPRSSKAPAGATNSTGPSRQQQPSAAAAAAPEELFVPLAVPAKLVPNLASDKLLKGILAKYGLPADGKKKVGGRREWTSLYCVLYGRMN